MSQRTGRKVPSEVASLPAKGKKSMAVGAMEKQEELNDGSKAPAPKPANEHKGPEGKAD